MPADANAPSVHELTFDSDDGWPFARCSCGWECENKPYREAAAEAYADHRIEVDRGCR